MNLVEIKKKVNELIGNVKLTKEKMDELKEWNSFDKIISNISDLILLIESVVISVESVTKELKLSSNNKLDIAAEIIDDMVDFPLLVEILDGYLIKAIISVVVYYINEKYGHEWKLPL